MATFEHLSQIGFRKRPLSVLWVRVADYGSLPEMLLRSAHPFECTESKNLSSIYFILQYITRTVPLYLNKTPVEVKKQIYPDKSQSYNVDH